MKQIFLRSFAALAVLGFAACNSHTDTVSGTSDSTVVSTNETAMEMASTQFDPNVGYTDLSSGATIHLKREDNGTIVNLETGEPVLFYVDMSTQDTFYGKTGAEVNNALSYTNGVYELNENYKETLEGDEYKLKAGDTKIKSTDEEYKYKDGDTKIKSNGKETKIKSGNTKIKIENGKTEIKTDD